MTTTLEQEAEIGQDICPLRNSCDKYFNSYGFKLSDSRGECLGLYEEKSRKYYKCTIYQTLKQKESKE